MANFTGTPFADVIFGTSDGDTIWGYGGDDFLNGRQGDDFLYGGDGNDTLHGSSGNDNEYGGNGDDLMTGGSGNDLMYGGTGNDYMSGGGGDDVVVGGMGDDWLQGGGGDDRILGGSGNDFIQGQAGNDAISGGQGSDTLNGGSGADQFHWVPQDFTNPKGSSDLVVDFHQLEGDKVYFSDDPTHNISFVTQAALNAALAAPGTEAVFSTSPGVDGITITYGNDQVTFVNPDHNVKYSNDPTKLDTHIVFTNHDGTTADIWFWDVQLQASDFVVHNSVGQDNVVL